MQKPAKILNLLLEGHEIELGGYKVLLDDNNDLCTYMGSTLVKVNFGNFELREFIKLCELMKEEDYITLLANITLNQINKGNVRNIRKQYNVKPTGKNT